MQTSCKSKLVSSYKIGNTSMRLVVCVDFYCLCDHKTLYSFWSLSYNYVQIHLHWAFQTFMQNRMMHRALVTTNSSPDFPRPLQDRHVGYFYSFFQLWRKVANIFEKRCQISLVKQGHYCKIPVIVTSNLFNHGCWIKGLLDREYCRRERNHQVRPWM